MAKNLLLLNLNVIYLNVHVIGSEIIMLPLEIHDLRRAKLKPQKTFFWPNIFFCLTFLNSDIDLAILVNYLGFLCSFKYSRELSGFNCLKATVMITFSKYTKDYFLQRSWKTVCLVVSYDLS